eukprot:5757132-Prymnesium_polylepis.1
MANPKTGSTLPLVLADVAMAARHGIGNHLGRQWLELAETSLTIGHAAAGPDDSEGGLPIQGDTHFWRLQDPPRPSLEQSEMKLQG